MHVLVALVLRRCVAALDLAMDQVIIAPLCARCSEQIQYPSRRNEATDARDVVIVS